jgi:hypothetical protein
MNAEINRILDIRTIDPMEESKWFNPMVVKDMKTT